MTNWVQLFTDLFFCAYTCMLVYTKWEYMHCRRFHKELGLAYLELVQVTRLNLGLILRSACYSTGLGLVLSPKISFKLGRVLWNRLQVFDNPKVSSAFNTFELPFTVTPWGSLDNILIISSRWDIETQHCQFWRWFWKYWIIVTETIFYLQRRYNPSFPEHVFYLRPSSHVFRLRFITTLTGKSELFGLMPF